MSSEILNVTERRGSTAGLTRLSRARQLWHCPGSAMLGQRWASSAGGRATNVDAPPVMTFAPGARLTGFITDVEGNARYLKSYCAPRGPSRVLTYSGTPAAGAAGDDEALVWNRHGLRLELRDGAHLVVGGDCFDKGAGDLRIAKAVVDLKRRHPERVFLLVGNRDNNKMRFSSELDPADVARAPTSIPRPYWLPPQALSFSSFLEEEWGDSRRELPPTKGARPHPAADVVVLCVQGLTRPRRSSGLQPSYGGCTATRWGARTPLKCGAQSCGCSTLGEQARRMPWQTCRTMRWRGRFATP